MNTYKFIAIFCCLITLSACQTAQTKADFSSEHLNTTQKSVIADSPIPKPVTVSPALPVPVPQKKVPTHTVIVNNVPVSELLFSLARDAQLNFDIDQNVDGLVTLNAINQPLDAILARIANSADLTYDIKNSVLRVSKDTPYLHNYRIDYINMIRNSESSATVSTQINSTGQGANGNNAAGNNSTTEVFNKSENSFWLSLYDNIAAIIYKEKVEEKSVPIVSSDGNVLAAAPPVDDSTKDSGDSGKNQNIVINKESGILAVRATKKQHRAIDSFINEVLYSTQRQVLIEVTIAEVSLSDSYQAGIDWSMLSNRVSSALSATNTITDIALFERPSFTLQTSSTNSDGDTIQTTLSALEKFGDVSIMSSPKVMALNNQTALLKVVDNVVYFTIEVNIERGEEGTRDLVTYETEVNTVPVGFVMSVTPFISDTNSVTLSVRPTISRVIAQARDPNPALAEVGVISEIPVIQVREVESILKVSSGNTAVMGGLMQDEIDSSSRGIPFLSRVPGLGRLFRYDSDTKEKTELVIFIRPIVVKHASLEGDFRHYKNYMPSALGG